MAEFMVQQSSRVDVTSLGVGRLTNMGVTLRCRALTLLSVSVLIAVAASCSDPGASPSSVTSARAPEVEASPSSSSLGESSTTVSDDGTTTTVASAGSSSSTTSVSAPSSPGSSVSSTTTTVRAGGSSPVTTVRSTTTTVRSTVTAPPATPAPTTPPTTPAPTAPPTTPAPTAPPRTIGSCQQVGLGTVNGWRVELGRPELGNSGSLYSGACSWATHLAELGGGSSHAPGVTGEVVYMNSGGCGGALNSWRFSSGHYAVLTASLATVGAIATVTDSNGKCWAVGRVA